MTKIFLADVRALCDESVFRHFFFVVPKSRQDKINGIKQQKDKVLSLGAGALLDIALKKMGLCNYQIKVADNGKPYIDSGSVFFNLSHSGDMVMCAISSKEVGCDVEKKRENVADISKRFCDKEREFILSKQGKERCDVLFRLWTLKESFMKALGVGHRIGLKNFCIDIKEDNISVEQKIDNKKYYFKEFFILQDYALSCCSEEENIGDITTIDFLDYLD